MKKFIKKYGLTALAVAASLLHANRLTYAIMQNSAYNFNIAVQVASVAMFAAFQLMILYFIVTD